MLLALIGYEWIVVAGILLVIFLWGPKKLPELARSIGLAKKEFEKVRGETSTILTPSTKPSTGSVESTTTEKEEKTQPTTPQ